MSPLGENRSAGIVRDRRALIDLALQDFNPALVDISDAAIASIDWPEGAARPKLITLPDHIENDISGGFEFVIIVAALLYRFWELHSDGFLGRYYHNGKTGSDALWSAFEAAWPGGIDPVQQIVDALHREGMEQFFGEMPDQESRYEILKSFAAEQRLLAVCQELREEIESTSAVTVSMATKLATAFPIAFDDPYLKKAQLALFLLAGVYRKRGLAIDGADLTAFADYQVPRVLRALGILFYNTDLAGKVDHHVLLPVGGVEEHAIRAATILACEKIAGHIGGTAAEVDNLLWRSQASARASRFHLTETTRY